MLHHSLEGMVDISPSKFTQVQKEQSRDNANREKMSFNI